MRRGQCAFVGVVVLLGCASSSAPTTRCGPGQHDAGSGSCVVDDALAVRNRAGVDYWRCVQSFGYVYKLTFVDTGTVTSGSGSFLFMNVGPPNSEDPDSTEARTSTFNWFEGGPSSLDIGKNPWFTSLIDIVPTRDAAGTVSSFTASFARFNLVQPPMVCTLTPGSF